MPNPRMKLVPSPPTRGHVRSDDPAIWTATPPGGVPLASLEWVAHHLGLTRESVALVLLDLDIPTMTISGRRVISLAALTLGFLRRLDPHLPLAELPTLVYAFASQSKAQTERMVKQLGHEEAKRTIKEKRTRRTTCR